MRRFFIETLDTNEKIVVIKGKEAHHIKDVVRLKVGDRFLGFNGSGSTYTLRIKKITDKVEAIIEKISSGKENMPKILLACALPKKSKIDHIIEKATELGVCEIVPMTTERTVVKLDTKSSTTKKRRWEKIALEASKQCGRDTLPKIHDLMSFKKAVELVSDLGYKNKILPCLCEGTKELRDIDVDNTKEIAVFIGPEGDFSEKEIEDAKANGFDLVSLGPLVLKVDTACFFSISVLQMILTR